MKGHLTKYFTEVGMEHERFNLVFIFLSLEIATIKL